MVSSFPGGLQKRMARPSPQRALGKTPDRLIDIGPEGGAGGGVVQGTPEVIVKAGKGHTARFLNKVLERRLIKGTKGVQREAAE